VYTKKNNNSAGPCMREASEAYALGPACGLCTNAGTKMRKALLRIAYRP